MRMANNKHWLSDVLTGAGIGILTTELGYYLADLIFKEKGIDSFANEDMFDRMEKPSFLSLYLGLNIPLSGYDIENKPNLAPHRVVQPVWRERISSIRISVSEDGLPFPIPL